MNNNLKNVGLLTWHFHNNVGGNLQAYALQSTITKMGYNCEIINYRKNYQINKKDCIKYVLGIVEEKTGIEKWNRYGIQFIKFRRDYLRESELVTNKKELEEICDKYDLILCGSDQIWAPNVLDDAYLLNFKCNKPKYAFSSSVGLQTIPSEQLPLYKNCLIKYNYFTVREKQTADYLSVLLNKKVEWTLDPTMLVDEKDWKNIEILPKNNKYIFCYFLSENMSYIENVDKLAKTLNLDVICYSAINMIVHNDWKYVYNIGPRQFIGYIDKCDFVITDSFHGTCFSILFNKQFLTLKRFKDDDPINQNIRVLNILNYFRLDNRLIDENGIDPHNIETIDYHVTNNMLAYKRKLSLNILMKMLSGGEN